MAKEKESSLGEVSEKDIEKKVEEKVENKIEKVAERFGEKFGFFIATVIQVILIFVAHRLTELDYPLFDFIKDDFDKLLWAVDLSLVAGIITNFVSIFTKDKKVRSAMNIFENFFSLILIWQSIKLFPYDFREVVSISWINNAVKFALYVGVFGILLSSVINLVKIFSKKHEK